MIDIEKLPILEIVANHYCGMFCNRRVLFLRGSLVWVTRIQQRVSSRDWRPLFPGASWAIINQAMREMGMAPLKTTTLEYFGSGVMAKLVVFLFQKCDIPKWLEPPSCFFFVFSMDDDWELGKQIKFESWSSYLAHKIDGRLNFRLKNLVF